MRELERVCDADAIVHLADCLRGESWYLRDLAEAALVRLGHRASPSLMPLLVNVLWFTRASAARIFGRIGEGAPWSDAPLGAAPLAGASGDFSIESAALGLPGNLAATGARMKLRFGGNQFAIEDLSGDLAGGKLAGRVRISRPDLIAFDGNLSLTGADVSRLISPADWRLATPTWTTVTRPRPRPPWMNSYRSDGRPTSCPQWRR